MPDTQKYISLPDSPLPPEMIVEMQNSEAWNGRSAAERQQPVERGAQTAPLDGVHYDYPHGPCSICGDNALPAPADERDELREALREFAMLYHGTQTTTHKALLFEDCEMERCQRAQKLIEIN